MSSNDADKLVSQDIIEQAVKNYVGNEPFSIQKTRVARGTEEIQGFASVILRVCVDFTVGGKVRNVSLIVKRLPVVQVQLKFISEMSFFERESLYYQDIVPELRKYCEAPFPMAACYFNQCDGVDDLLVFEDLQSSNFKSLGFNTPVGLQHCKVAMRELAKVHAASVAVEMYSGEKLNEMFPIFKKDALFPKFESNGMKLTISESVKVILGVCEEIPEFKHLVPALKKKLDTIWEQFGELVSPRTDQMNVLCQGDCSFNNMMFRFDDDGQPIAVKLIDMQITRYASPFTDILYFLHMGLDRNIRVQHWNEILEEYISSFNRCIVKFSIPVNALQMDQVKRDYDEMKLYGILIDVAFRPIFLMRTDVMPTDHNDGEEKFDQMYFGERTSAAKAKFNSSEDFRTEMHAIIEDLRDIYKL